MKEQRKAVSLYRRRRAVARGAWLAAVGGGSRDDGQQHLRAVEKTVKRPRKSSEKKPTKKQCKKGSERSSRGSALGSLPAAAAPSRPLRSRRFRFSACRPRRPLRRRPPCSRSAVAKSGNGNARQRQCLREERRWKRTAKAVLSIVSASHSIAAPDALIILASIARALAACAVRNANMGHQLAVGNSSWCPELESQTTHRRVVVDDEADAAATVIRQLCAAGGGRRHRLCVCLDMCPQTAYRQTLDLVRLFIHAGERPVKTHTS